MLPRRFFLTLLLSTLTGLSLWRARFERERAEALCARLSGEDTSTFRGGLFLQPAGRIVLRSPVWLGRSGREISFPGTLILEPPIAKSAPELGRLVRISGPFQCSVAKRNPGSVEDGTLAVAFPRIHARGERFRVVVDPRPAPPLLRFQAAFRGWLAERTTKFSSMAGLVDAVWTGDSTGLPLEMVAFYREAGLLPVLALSGQHVAILVFLLSRASRLGARLPGFRTPWPRFRRILPLICAAILWVSSGGAPSVLRTFALMAALFLLQARGMRTSLLQATTTSVALALVFEPSLASYPGFVLSAAATGLLGALALERGPTGVFSRGAFRRWRRAWFVGLVMPILAFPLTAYFFAKVSWAASLHSVVLGTVWAFVWIPVGFLLPWVGPVLPSFAVRGIEVSWEKWGVWDSTWATLVPTGWTTVVRPTALELALIEGLLISGALVLHRVFVGESDD